jgi:hypothetical protein
MRVSLGMIRKEGPNVTMARSSMKLILVVV